MRRNLTVAAVLAWLAGAAGAARAGGPDEPETVGILHVAVDGVSETAAEMLENSLEDGLGNAGFLVAKQKDMAAKLEQSDYFEGCLFGPCLNTVYEVTGVRLLLVARITGLGQRYSIVVTLIDARTGVPTSQATDRCEVCTVDEAVATASMTVIGLVTGAGDTQVIDASIGPTGDGAGAAEVPERETELQAKFARRGTAMRRGAWLLLGAAAVAGGVSVFGFLNDDTDLGAPAAAAAGAFAVSSGTLFVISRKF